MNVIDAVRRSFAVRLAQHVARVIVLGALSWAMVAAIAFVVLKLLALASLAPSDGIGARAAGLGFWAGLLAGALYFNLLPPTHSANLRKGQRYRVKESFSAGGHQFRAGEVLVFQREWTYLTVYPDYPATEEDREFQGADIYNFIDESNTVRTITSRDFPHPSLWTWRLDQASDGD